MTGRLIGVGVGPGDPELITLKAARLIREADVVAYPVANGTQSRARDIAAAHIATEAIEVPFDLPMRTTREPAQAAYDTTSRTLLNHLQKNRKVAVLCEGDPMFFGSFMYLAARLSDQHAVEIVPGITSISAASASLRRPLCARNETFAVVAATDNTADITDALSRHDSVAILKVGRHMNRIRDAIASLDLMARAGFVANASCDGEIAVPLAHAPEVAPYFSLILVTKGRDPWLHPTPVS